ncbi:MAG TPA: type II toxin-antitoxin system PemK/MazF family toxin [Chloroflexota bacterium]
MSARRPLARGDVVLITFPFTDLSGQKVRPAVVVGRVTGTDVIVAFITSQAGGSVFPAECALDPTDPEFSRTGLRVASRIRLDKLATLHRALVQRRIGRIGPSTEQAFAAALRHVFVL